MRGAQLVTLCSWLLLSSACAGTTGHPLLAFKAAAAGPSDATGGSLAFDNGVGYHVVLTRARLHIGAVYLNQSTPLSGGGASSCILSGIYVGEVWGPLDVDVLSPALQAFPTTGDGTATEAKVGELWLYGEAPYTTTDGTRGVGDINNPNDPTVILDAAGTAEKDGVQLAFTASLTIGQNRVITSSDPSARGANPICKQRIVSPIPIALTPTDGGTLVIRVDPRVWFGSVDFSTLTPYSETPPLYHFADAATDVADISLYGGLHSSSAYHFAWQ